jgi:DNA-binding transcriptional regulator YiaG
MSKIAKRRWDKMSASERREFALMMVRARRASTTITMAPEAMKRARASLRLTQRELAAKLKVHPISVARWEGGARGISERTADAMRQLL